MHVSYTKIEQKFNENMEIIFLAEFIMSIQYLFTFEGKTDDLIIYKNGTRRVYFS